MSTSAKLGSEVGGGGVLTFGANRSASAIFGFGQKQDHVGFGDVSHELGNEAFSVFHGGAGPIQICLRNGGPGDFVLGVNLHFGEDASPKAEGGKVAGLINVMDDFVSSGTKLDEFGGGFQGGGFGVLELEGAGV